MDFLDPRKKRSNKIRLAIGHSLMVILVFTATYILVFRAYGYDYDTKTGQVVQDGLVYVDSAPDGAKITINGQQEKSNTNTRFALPEGKYTLQISKDGYSDWTRSFQLEGGQVLRYDYPVLFPVKLSSSQIESFKPSITFASESPDRRWVVLDEKNKLSSMTLYDLQKPANQKPTSTNLAFPGSLFKPASGDNPIKLVEWSTDNRHILVSHDYSGGKEFVVLDIQQPDESYNVNTTLDLKPSKVNLFNKKFDKLLIYSKKSKVLSRVDAKTKSVQSYASNVISYKAHGDDTLLFSRPSPTDKTKAEAVMRQKNKDYVIKEIPLSDDIPLDIAQYNKNWYVVIGVESEHRSYVYKDPIDLILNHDENVESIQAIVLRNSGPIDEISFSQNARFIMSNSGQNFSIYDAEQQEHYSYSVSQKFDGIQNPAWMDGHRIMASSDGKILVFDYDGINKRSLIKADPALPVMFNRNYTEMYSLSSLSSNKTGFTLTQLRLPADR